MDRKNTTAHTVASNTPKISDQEFVELQSLAQLAGFPVDFVKKELLTEENALSLDELRQRMMVYLQETFLALDTPTREF
jgi:hypothetical protein